MKLKLKFKQEDLAKKVREISSKVFSKESMTEFLDGIASKYRENIQKRVSLSSGGMVSEDLAKKKPFVALLSKKYIAKRRKSSELSGKTKPSMSNLTYSRQMIESITGKGTGTLQGEIYLKDDRKRLKGQKKAPRNSQLAEWHENGTDKMPARPFLHISDTEYKTLIQEMQKKLNAYLKKQR